MHLQIEKLVNVSADCAKVIILLVPINAGSAQVIIYSLCLIVLVVHRS